MPEPVVALDNDAVICQLLLELDARIGACVSTSPLPHRVRTVIYLHEGVRRHRLVCAVPEQLAVPAALEQTVLFHPRHVVVIHAVPGAAHRVVVVVSVLNGAGPRVLVHRTDLPHPGQEALLRTDLVQSGLKLAQRGIEFDLFLLPHTYVRVERSGIMGQQRRSVPFLCPVPCTLCPAPCRQGASRAPAALCVTNVVPAMSLPLSSCRTVTITASIG